MIKRLCHPVDIFLKSNSVIPDTHFQILGCHCQLQPNFLIGIAECVSQQIIRYFHDDFLIRSQYFRFSHCRHCKILF